MKNSTIILIVIMSLMVILITAFMVFLLVDNRNFSFVFNGKTTLLLDEVYEENVSKIEVDVISADVHIKEAEDNNLRVIAYGKEKETIESTIENDTLSIRRTGNHFCFGFCFGKEEVTIYIPRDRKVDLDIKTISGEVEIATFKNSNVDVKTTSGDIKIGEVSQVKLKSVSGDIYLEKGSNVEAATTSGDLKLKYVLTSINAKSVSGEIQIENLDLENDSTIHTTSGDVTIRSMNNLYIETSTLSGDINISNNNRYANTTLKIETTSGDISVK